jgi:hypothetical protein
VAASARAHAEIDSTNPASLPYTSSILRRSPRFDQPTHLICG